ncbi:MAG TPA: glycosyltransferase, partial [Actinomycetota bacterium]|nr:glycosyltransferase [Actinomycetota bacterium]
LDPSARIVVTVARLVPQKALDVLLAAVALLPDDVHLAIVGDGRLRGELETHARASGIAPRAHFLGYKPDAADYVAAADVFCLSSVWEAVPLAAQEAVLLGVPVVATDVGGLRELVEDGTSGRLTAPKDPQALASALKEVLFDPRIARTYAHRALEDYVARFSRARMLQDLAAIYRALAATSA